MAYVSRTDLLAYLDELSGGISSPETPGEEAVLDTFISQAQAEIERVTSRKFETSTATRTYGRDAIAPDGVLWLDDDLLDVDTLTNGDGSTISGSEYVLLPRNESPKYGIKLKSSASWAFSTDGEIAVAGDWGFSAAAPADVKRLCMRLAWFYWMKRGTTGETQTLDGGGILSASEYPEDIKNALKRLTRRTVR
jgi:hypothetical protein